MPLKKYVVVLESQEMIEFDKLADSQERSRSFLIRKAIQNFLKGVNQNATN